MFSVSAVRDPVLSKLKGEKRDVTRRNGEKSCITRDRSIFFGELALFENYTFVGGLI
jgi:hypothetical protein